MVKPTPQPHKGRGAAFNPNPRYLDERRETVDDGWGSGELSSAPLSTVVTEERARSIIAHNRSPDIPFQQSINPYRGCEHGCVYCYARPSHAYLDLSPGLDFETKLFAKTNAAELLEAELARPGYRCRLIALGANTDPYQPIERERRITRRVIEVLARCRHPVSIVTKSALVERDIDLLAAMAADNLAEVHLSITTLDNRLAAKLEPRANAPVRRVECLRRLTQAGIPVGVMFAPVIPALNDRELEAVLESAAEAGACYAGYVMLRLPHEVKDLFKQWLETHEPLKAERVMNRIRDLRSGRENDHQFGTRLRGVGIYAKLLRKRFDLACQRNGLNRSPRERETSLFAPPTSAAGRQMSLSL